MTTEKPALDGVQERYHVRKRDNRVAIVLNQPGWASDTASDYWYVSIEDLPKETKRWQHRAGSTYPGGMPKIQAYQVLREWYQRESTGETIPNQAREISPSAESVIFDLIERETGRRPARLHVEWTFQGHADDD